MGRQAMLLAWERCVQVRGGGAGLPLGRAASRVRRDMCRLLLEGSEERREAQREEADKGGSPCGFMVGHLSLTFDVDLWHYFCRVWNWI